MEYLLIFIPAFMVMSLALRDQYYRKDSVGTALLSVTTVLVILRFCILAHFFHEGEHNFWLTLMEQISSLYIMPFIYMYLRRLAGTSWFNGIAILLLCLPCLSAGALHPTVDGELVRNALVIIQCLTICLATIYMWRHIPDMHLTMSRRLQFFFVWMAILLLFTIISFALNLANSTDHSTHWSFFILYTIFITAGYLVVPYSFVIQEKPETEETSTEEVQIEEEIEEEKEEFANEQHIDHFEQQNEHLARALHKMMEEDQYFLNPNITIDMVAHRLGTNRTYVTRLMKQEHGLTFIEYVNVARIQYSQKLLYTSPHTTLEDVAEKAGYQSVSNYCRAFKRYTGMTPKGWLQTIAH